MDAHKVQTVGRLQKISADAVQSTLQHLKPGMSEHAIADIVRAEFASRGVTKFWYDVPLIILIGTERFLQAANADYATKTPSNDFLLEPGSPVYIDVHPQDTKTTLWGDWNTMTVFQPRPGIDDEQVAFLEEMQAIHREGISKLTPDMTGKGIMDWYLNAYKSAGITPILGADMGHTVHEGPKLSSKRLLIKAENTTPIGGYIYAIEPAGLRQKQSGDGVLVARFEECAYIPPAGKAIRLGGGR